MLHNVPRRYRDKARSLTSASADIFRQVKLHLKSHTPTVAVRQPRSTHTFVGIERETDRQTAVLQLHLDVQRLEHKPSTSGDGTCTKILMTFHERHKFKNVCKFYCVLGSERALLSLGARSDK